MKIRITILFLLITSSFYAQISKEKTWRADAIKTLTIAGDGVFKINVKNGLSETITLKVKIDGEYAENLVVLDSISAETLFISSAFQPLFVSDNDKLSAHKVLSVEYDLIVPKHVSLDVKSDIASVNITGIYTAVFIESNQGTCQLQDFLGDAVINTIDGNIAVQTNHAKVEAFSKTGTVEIIQFKYGKYAISCHSINGNINVTKIEK